MFHLIDNNRITFRKTLNKWQNKILINFHIDPLLCPIKWYTINVIIHDGGFIYG